MKVSKPYILIATIIVIAGVIDFINANSVSKKGSDEAISVVPRMSSEQSGTKKEEKSKRYELAKEITTPDGYINTDGKAIAINSLIGKKVILIDFWTYSCINCQRTTPYLNAWYEKYKDKGFVIIGIHTPEFGFEKDYNNVKAAVEKFGIKFPVVLDNDYSTWTAYKNQYWPRKYLIDIDGYVVYDHIGEGQYEETEQKIQEALGERMAILGEDGTIDKAITKEIPVQGGPKSPETYFGATRNQFFGNGTRGVVGDQKSLIAPAKINPDTLYLSGDWNIANESAQNGSPNAGIVYKYNAKDVFFVSQADNEIVVEVLRDGEPLGSEAGADIVKNSDGKTFVKIKEARLYKIIQGDRSEAHIIEFRILKPGLEAFTFTFG
ncbi:MAG: redoxin family protein [Patescibacteria group bacterium]